MNNDTTAADILGHGHGTCDEAIDKLYWFLDGELTEDRRRQIQRHLDECSPCLGAFDFEAELKAVVATRCREKVPERLRQRVTDILAEARGSGGLGPSASGGGTEL